MPEREELKQLDKNWELALNQFWVLDTDVGIIVFRQQVKECWFFFFKYLLIGELGRSNLPYANVVSQGTSLCPYVRAWLKDIKLVTNDAKNVYIQSNFHFLLQLV